MRWVLITCESLVTGALTVVVSLAAFVVSLSAYTRYVLGVKGQVGWDVVSLFGAIFGQYWKVIIVSILVAIFLFGSSAGFWFFSQRVHRSERKFRTDRL